MKRIARFVFILFMPCFLTSCTEPVRHFAKDESIIRQAVVTKSWKKIVVLPFTGEPEFRRSAAEWCAFQIGEHGLFEMTGPAIAEIELKKRGMVVGENDLKTEEVQNAGRMLRADAVIVGSIAYAQQVYIIMAQQVPVATISIIDIATGKIAAIGKRSEPLVSWRFEKVNYDRHERVMWATKRVIEDMLPLLYTIAGKTWMPLRKEELAAPRPGSVP